MNPTSRSHGIWVVGCVVAFVGLVNLLWRFSNDVDLFFVGCVFGLLFTVLAWKVGFLRLDGAIVGGLFGWSLITLSTWAWTAPALAFFILSSVLSRVGNARKSQARMMEAKGSQRDAGQVLANGGVAWLLLLLYGGSGDGLLYWGFIGAFSAAAADTWATEIGTLSEKPPRSIRTGRVLPTGASGGVSVLGSLGAIAGAVTISLVALIFSDGNSVMGVVLVGVGVVASLVDSLLGATVQAIYRHQTTGQLTESPCRETQGYERIQGWTWVSNDVVNWGCTLFGALATMLLFAVLGFAS